MKYFYDGQFRKYIQQFIRIFSGFSVQIGKSVTGEPIYRTVPVNYGDITRMAAHILKNNSENVLNTTPFIAVYINSIRMAPNRRTNPQHTLTDYVVEKKYDYTTGDYTNEPGNTYEVTRYMPVPYDLGVMVDIWTSNTEQKLQILEQIYPLFNPSINLRTNNNPYDWSNLTVIEMADTTWTNRSIPSGVDDIIDISSMQFTVPIYINPPALVRKQSVIHTIINRIHEVDGSNLQLFESGLPFNSQFTSYVYVTLENYKLQFDGVRATLLNKNGDSVDESGNPLDWSKILPYYGSLREGMSQIRLRRNLNPDDDSDDIIGTISLDPSSVSNLLVDLDSDTVPSNTLGNVNRIVDGGKNYPGDGTLPTEALDQKYLLIGPTSSDGVWGLDANENDIIRYDGSGWVVFFNSATSDNDRVFDLNSNKQYEWNGIVWQESYIGIYNAGYWRLYL